MSSTDTTGTAPAAAAATAAAPNIFQQIEATLSADWQKLVSFFQQVAQAEADFMAKVATGLPILLADIESALGIVAGKITTINSGLAVASDLAAKVAPNNTSVQKLLSDIGQGAQDLADVHVALSAGVSSGDNTVVTTAVTAINAANDLSQLLNSANAQIGTIAGASPTAAQTVSQPTPAAD